MSFAILDSDNRIIEVISSVTKGAAYIELGVEDMTLICESKFGHAEFSIIDGVLVKTGMPKAQFDEKEIPEMLDPVMGFEENPHEVGSFGNVWVRKLYFPTKDIVHEGHSHDYDHISLLLSGGVSVEVPGYELKTFVAPTYIIIRADYEHKIIALEDKTLWWCLHAMRGEDGEIELYGKSNDPLGG